MHEAIMVSAALGICLVSTIWNWKNIKKEKEFIKELKTVSTAYDFIKKGVNYPRLKSRASCFIDQTCYRDYIPSSRGPISTGIALTGSDRPSPT